MTDERKFLGKFPIVECIDYDTTRVIQVSNEDKSYNAQITFNQFEDQIDITCAISHEGIDNHLVPRLILIRDLHNRLVEKLKEERAIKSSFDESLFDLAFTKKVLPPKFYLSLDQQGSLREIKADIKAEEFADIYTDLVNRICEEYAIQNPSTEKDWLHEERIILPVIQGYTFELTKPTSHFQTFEIHADNKVDYTKLSELATSFKQLTKTSLGEKIKIYDNDELTNCNFRISLDISNPKILQSRVLERLLITQS